MNCQPIEAEERLKAASPSVRVKRPQVAVLFHRLGPYHFARLKAAATRMRVAAVEFSNVDSTYDWDLIPGADGFERRTLFTGQDVGQMPTDRIVARMNEVLNELRPEALAVAGWHERCSLAALLWGHARNVPVVVMSESTAWDETRRWWKEAVKRRVLQLCSSGLVGGRAHALYLTQLGLDPDQIFSGYDVVDNSHFAEKAEAARRNKTECRRRNKLPEKYFLASARFIDKKNLPGLIQAYSIYRARITPSGEERGKGEPWDLVLLGDGSLRGDLIRLISDLGLNDAVHLPGFKQYAELPEFYGLAGAFVHASMTEQWGLVVNEAMAAGLPVLVSDRCGCAGDLVQEGVNGFTFNPAKPEELANLMLKVSDGSFPLSEFGAASVRLMAAWGPERFAQGLEGATERALKNYRPKSQSINQSLVRLLLRR